MRCAVLGDPIEHSLSPVLHRAGYAAAGLDWEYDAQRVPSGGLGGFLDALDDTWRGLSLTMPLKREAVGLLAGRAGTVTETVRLAGAANTLVLDDGAVHADNTDVPGAVAALGERGVQRLSTATILGGGATATSVGLALAGIGVAAVSVLVRDRARTVETEQRLVAAGLQVFMGDLDTDPVGGDLVVSTIPARAQVDGLLERCRAVPAVFEALYDPWPTPLAAAAMTDGRILVTGLDLLVHQAALQFVLFTGAPADLDAMREAGERALEERQA